MNTIARRTLAGGLAAIFVAVSAPALAAKPVSKDPIIFCRNKAGKVSIRTACKKKEVQVEVAGGALPQGPEGVHGPQGPTGAVGPQGPKGDRGLDGVAGLPGLKGDKGEHGDKGDKGDQGYHGDKGERGDKGDKGDQGNHGDKGDQGDKGDKGDHGDNGVKGDKGDPGDKGDKGDKGDPDDKGDKGDSGPQGPKGVSKVKQATLPLGATVIPNTGDPVTLGTFTIEPGTYLINAKMWLANAQLTSSPRPHYLRCSLVAIDPNNNLVDSDTNQVTVAIAMNTATPGATVTSFVIANSFDQQMTVTLNCLRLDNNAGSTSAYNIKLTAAAVDSITN